MADGICLAFAFREKLHHLRFLLLPMLAATYFSIYRLPLYIIQNKTVPMISGKGSFFSYSDFLIFTIISMLLISFKGKEKTPYILVFGACLAVQLACFYFSYRVNVTLFEFLGK
jgi:hypothetical protein